MIGQVTATGGDYAYTLQLDVGTQEISNWSTRSEDFETINFSTEFSDIPVVISQVQSDGNYNINCTKSNGSSWTADGYDYLFRTRQQNYTTLSFEAILETDLQVGGGSSISSIDSVEGSETVGWLAFSSSASGLWTEMPFEVALTDEIITESTTSISFTGPFTDAPQLLGAVATNNDSDQAGVGLSALSESQAKLYMDEFDDGSHSAEAIALLMLQGNGSLKDINGDIIGTIGTSSIYDSERDAPFTIEIQKYYANPVVFAQPLSTEFDDAVFRFTDISNNSFSGYVHHDYEGYGSQDYKFYFDMQYFIFETGSWEVGIEDYTYSIIDGDENEAFFIDTNSGEITVKDSTQLDYESGVTQYVLTIQATDVSGNSESTNLTININNLSDTLNAEATHFDGVSSGDLTGWSFAKAGDVNGDGLEDIIIGAPHDDTNGGNAGCAYVVFGSSDGSTPELDDVISGNGGFVIYGESENDKAGFAVSGGHDVNGDGLDDLAIGAPFADPNEDESGKAYVVFGKSDTSAVDLSAVALDTDNSGFVMNGACLYDHAGGSILLGDVNGDGLADITIGEVRRNVNNNFSSQDSDGDGSMDTYDDPYIVYTVLGKTDGNSIELADIADDSNDEGFAVKYSDRNATLGQYWLPSVMSAGDFNTDGLMDVFIDSGILSNLNKFLAFGKIDTNTINFYDEDDGVTINTYKDISTFSYYEDDENHIFFLGVNTSPGYFKGPLGDVNADGLDDIAILAPDSGYASDWDLPRAYIIFGKTQSSSVTLSAIESGSGGFIIYNDSSNASYEDYDFIYGAISGAGDINGDGYDDIIIGEPDSDEGNGRVYIVYGKSDTDAIYLSEIVSTGEGFYSVGNANDYLGDYLASAGDYNGDGISDMLFGAPLADPDSMGNAGSVYLMPGNGDKVTLWGTTDDDTLTGSTDDDSIAAGQGNDTLTSAGGKDVLYGGPGDDTIIISDTDFIRIDGGTGTDTLEFDGAGLTLYLSNESARVRNIEIIDITGSGDNTLSFNKTISGSTRIIIKGDSGDSVFSINQLWTSDNIDFTLDGVTYNIYSSGSSELWLQTGMSISINTPPTISDQSFTIDEYTSGGTVIGTIEANDTDITDSLTFEITDGNSQEFFDMDSSTGELSVSDSVRNFDYEDQTSYSLSVEVTDQFNETASATITVNITDTSELSVTANLDLSATDYTIWGTDLIGTLLGETSTSDSYSTNFSNLSWLPLNLEVINMDVDGIFEAGYYFELDGGTLDASLPCTFTLNYPDEIQAGKSVELETSFMLDESAGFTVTCPNFYAGANTTVTDFRFQLDTSFPINIWEDYAGGYDIDFSADEIDQTISIESGEHTEQDSEIFAGFGKALNLDGDNGYVQVELSGILETSETSFSFETWFKADTLSTDQVLWSQQDGDGTGGAWLWLDSSGSLSTDLGGTTIRTSTVIDVNTWNHAALTYDITTSEVNIYLNGEREATETITMESCNGDLILGSNNAYSNNFDGAMDETRIWTVARSQEEIEQNMGLQVSATDESDLLIYYTY